MIRISQQDSAKSAKSYYTTADYYTEGQELIGSWGGKGAARLGLSGPVDQSSFERLYDNLDPKSGEQLTVRTQSERTVGYDFTFSVPKSVSLLYAMSGDQDILGAFRSAVDETMQDMEADSRAQRSELQRQEKLIVGQQDRLLNMRLAEEIDEATFARKHTEMRDRLASIKVQLDVLDRSHDETADLAAKVFELSQTLRQQWLTADYDTKRRILEIVCLNCKLDDTTLVLTMRKPFDVLAEGLLSENSRDDRI